VLLELALALAAESDPDALASVPVAVVSAFDCVVGVGVRLMIWVELLFTATVIVELP